MARFVAIKIHYDHRKDLAAHLKYTQIASREEYDKYLELYKQGVGGEGFHECLNFRIPEEDPVRFYLPPRYVPRPRAACPDEDYLIFSFTYKTDPELPSHVVGVHARARIVSSEGIRRSTPERIDEVTPLVYHAESPSEDVSLFVPPLAYDLRKVAILPCSRDGGLGCAKSRRSTLQTSLETPEPRHSKYAPKRTTRNA